MLKNTTAIKKGDVIVGVRDEGMWQDTPTEVAKLIAQGFYA